MEPLDSLHDNRDPGFSLHSMSPCYHSNVPAAKMTTSGHRREGEGAESNTVSEWEVHFFDLKPCLQFPHAWSGTIRETIRSIQFNPLWNDCADQNHGTLTLQWLKPHLHNFGRGVGGEPVKCFLVPLNCNYLFSFDNFVMVWGEWFY